jgi:hypothetical protein
MFNEGKAPLDKMQSYNRKNSKLEEYKWESRLNYLQVPSPDKNHRRSVSSRRKKKRKASAKPAPKAKASLKKRSSLLPKVEKRFSGIDPIVSAF